MTSRVSIAVRGGGLRTLAGLALIVAAALQSTSGPGTVSAQSPPSAVQAFVGARIVTDPRKPAIADGVLVVRDGRVVAVGPRASVSIPAGAARQDVTGKTILPGLINTHGHVGATQGLRNGAELYTRENVLAQLGLYSRYGITTVFSLGDDREAGVTIRDEQRRGDVPAVQGRSRLFVAGPVVTGDTPAQAREVVDRVAAMKVDLVKIRVDDNLGASKKMAPDVYGAVIDAAHAKRLRVAAHLYYLDDAKTLLDAGADFLAHSVRDREVDAALIAALKRRNVCVCPTLTREVSTFVYESTPDFFADPFFTRDADPAVVEALKDPKRQESMRGSKSAQSYKQSLPVASRNLKALSDAGVPIAFGTDSGMPARFQGYFEHMELEMMVKAGLTPAQALASATTVAAECMQQSGTLGTLAPGGAADFVVFQKNPVDDIRHTRTLESTWIAGQRVAAR